MGFDWLFGVRLKWTLEELQFFTLDFGFVLEGFFASQSRLYPSSAIIQDIQNTCIKMRNELDMQKPILTVISVYA